MKKSTVVLLSAAALVLVFLIFALTPLSRLVLGRSLAAQMLVWQLHKDAYTTEEAFEDYLAQKRGENASDYRIPEGTAAYARFVRGEYAGMTFFTINGARPAGGRVVFYFPGGSYIDQPRELHWDFLTRLADDTGACVVVPLYPKLPDSDAETACAALTDAFAEYTRGMPYGELVFMGDSAGGGLALSLAMRLRDAGLDGPDRLVLICPWVDVTMENPAIGAYEKTDPALDRTMLARLGALWAGELAPEDPVVSPLYGGLGGLGPVTLLTTDGELLYPDILRLDAALAAAGVEHELVDAPRMFHVWPLYVSLNIPEAQEAYETICAAVTGQKLTND